MKEQDLKDLGFEPQHETAESSGYSEDWYYYTLDIGDICLITNTSDEVGWEVSIFDFTTFLIKNIGDLEALISIIKNNLYAQDKK